MEITIRFDPDTTSEPLIKEIFADDIARTFWLLWRRGHIVSQYFNQDTLDFAQLFRQRQPKNAEELRQLFPPLHEYFTPGDVQKFCPEAWPYLAGEKTVTYVIKGESRRN